MSISKSVFKVVNKSVFRGILVGGFDPLLLNPLLWLDALDPDTISLSGSNVTKWDDKSGYGYDVDQGSTSLQPVLESGGIRFTSDYLDGVGNNISGVPFDLFIVAKDTSIKTATNSYYIGTSGATSGESLFFGHRSDAAGNTFAYSIGVLYDYPNPVTLGERFITSAYQSASGLDILFNEVSQLSNNENTLLSGNRDYMIGTAYYEASRTREDTTIYEILITPTLTEPQRQQVTNYLADKWGIAI